MHIGVAAMAERLSEVEQVELPVKGVGDIDAIVDGLVVEAGEAVPLGGAGYPFKVGGVDVVTKPDSNDGELVVSPETGGSSLALVADSCGIAIGEHDDNAVNHVLNDMGCRGLWPLPGSMAVTGVGGEDLAIDDFERLLDQIGRAA